MKLLAHQKLDTLSSYQRREVLEGYDVYLPSGFWNVNVNPSSDCPIFIDKGDKDCIVVTAEDINNWENETILFIKQNLPKIEDPICRFVSPAQIKKDALPSFLLELSREVYDRRGNVMVDVLALKREPSDDILERLEELDIKVPSIEVMIANCQDKSFLNGVIDVILKGIYCAKYRGLSMWYKPQEEDYSIELGFLQTEVGISYKTIE